MPAWVMLQKLRNSSEVRFGADVKVSSDRSRNSYDIENDLQGPSA